MIPIVEFNAKARELGVPVSTIESDYAQNWLLKYLSSENMILKGGTGIRKVYIENYRFSDDLDFTLKKSINPAGLEEHIKNSITRAHEESGINFQQNFEIVPCESGFTVKVYFNIARRGGLPLKIKLDITLPEKEDILLPVEKRNIIHLFSDECNAFIPAYNLDEILAEKIRTLFERTRPRDLFDVWFFVVNENKIIPETCVLQKCEFKNVDIDLSKLLKRKELFVKTWLNSLRHQIKNLPDPDEAFDRVYSKLYNMKFA